MRRLLCVATLSFLIISTARAEVTALGDVSPIPDPAGGNLNGTLLIGQGLNNGATTIGIMQIDNGTELNVSNLSVVGSNLGANGFVTVDGLASNWITSNDVEIGRRGRGDLTVQNQAWVESGDDFIIASNNSGRGTVLLSDTGSILNVRGDLIVGSSGSGKLFAWQNSSAISDNAFIARDVDSVGAVELADEASWRSRRDLLVGGAGHATLSIFGSALMENTSAIIGNAVGSTGQVTVSDFGSLWLNRSNLTVGNLGQGELAIENGGLVQALGNVSIGTLGQIQLSEGRLVADNVSVTGELSGSGTISGNINNTASGSIRTQRDGELLLVGNVTNAGTIDGVFGELETLAALTNTDTGFIGGHDVVYRFSAGLTNVGELGFTTGVSDVFGDIESSGTVTVDGAGTVTFYDDFVNSGEIRIEPEAHAVFFGNVTIAAAARLTVGGLAADPAPSGEPSVNEPITGSAAFALAGELSLFPSTSPDDVSEPTERGTSVTLSILSAESISGEFGQVRYDEEQLTADFLEENGSFRGLDRQSDVDGMFRALTYGSGQIQLTNYLALPGDADGDQSVGFADFLILSENFGNQGGWLEGDFDGDGMVSFADFLQLSSSFGDSSAAAVAVPEPATAPVAMLLAVMGFLRFRRLHFV